MLHDLNEALLTPRLRIEPLTRRLSAVARKGPEALAEAIDADVPPEWSAAGGLRLLARAWRLEDQSAAPERALVIHRCDERVIGDLRFSSAGRPRGAIELGYAITSLYRRQGYATEAAGGLLDWAFAHDAGLQVIAGCDRGNRASVRTLRRLGFWLDGAHVDAFWWLLTADLRAEARAREL